MIHIQKLRDGLPLFRALDSETRISIVELLSAKGPQPMTAISQELGITSGALTPHIKALVDCGLVDVEMSVGKHGLQKVCSVVQERIIIDPTPLDEGRNMYETEIGVGQYTAYEIYPTCGIATSDHLIGEVDEPRFFGYPERTNAGIVWFGKGYVEYMVPNLLRANQRLLELQISLEISSEAPGVSEDWPSDIYFSINGRELGYWTSPGDFGRTEGIYNPDWWFRNWNQHGLFKLLSVNDSGSFIDGFKISNVRLSDLGIDNSTNTMTLRLGVPDKARNQGGLTIYGRGFGNYLQDIKVRMHYRDTGDKG